jgi:predicted nucleic acid-binding protein
VIYLDAAALVKLVHPEAESADLQLWLAERAGMVRVSSALVDVEVPRAIRRHAPASQPNVPVILGTVARFDIDQAVRTLAGSYTDPLLRSLDAIHLATVQVLTAELGEPPVAFVTYDKRLLAAAKAAGFRTASPGVR